MIPNSGSHKRRHLRVFSLVFASAVLLLLSGAGFIIRTDRQYEGRIYPNVYIDDQNVGGKSRREVLALFAPRENKIKSSRVFVSFEKTNVATFSAQQLNLHTNTEEIFSKAYFVGRTPHYPSRIYQKLATLLGLDRFSFSTQVQYDKSPVEDFLDDWEEAYNKQPKNALFKFENDRVVSFHREENGSRLESDAFRQDLEQAVRSLKFRQQDYTLTLRQSVIKPDVTLAQSNNFGIEELIGEGVSNYTHSIPGRIHNVILAASKFNGVLIPKGKTLSFNDTVGDISASTGYQPAYIIKEGKTVLGDGGGVCQVSTTLFRAALNAGLPIPERYAHAYRVSYYENDSKPGLDATVFAPSVDLKIENNTPAAILVQTEVDEDKMLLYFRLYGKKDNRKVEVSTPILYDVAGPPPAVYQDDPTQKRGSVKQVDFAAWGGKASFTYKVTLDNKVLTDKTFLSVYKPWAAVFLVGTQD